MFYGVNSIYFFCVYLFLVFVRPKSKVNHYGTQCLPTSVPVSTFPVSTWTPSGNEVAETLNSLQSLNVLNTADRALNNQSINDLFKYFHSV